MLYLLVGNCPPVNPFKPQMIFYVTNTISQGSKTFTEISLQQTTNQVLQSGCEVAWHVILYVYAYRITQFVIQISYTRDYLASNYPLKCSLFATTVKWRITCIYFKQKDTKAPPIYRLCVPLLSKATVPHYGTKFAFLTLFRMISGARYSLVPQKVQVCCLQIFLANPKSTSC